MADFGAPPPPPDEAAHIYNSYYTDPQWQRTFTIAWTSVMACAVLLRLPRLYKSIQRRFVAASHERGAIRGTLRMIQDMLGISESLSPGYRPLNSEVCESAVFPGRGIAARRLVAVLRTIGALFYWTLPWVGLNFGQLILLTAYLATVLVCYAKDVPLVENSNRPGFIAVAQLPVVFLFATKNSILGLLLGPGNGWEKLNWIHRWSGRAMFVGSVIHGSLWIRNHLQWKLAIIGQEKETTGIAAMALLAIITLSSLPFVRRKFYQAFFIIHVLAFPAFFITLCYHTIYAVPFIFPPITLYGLDILLRMFRYRVKDALLIPVDKQMTLIRVANCDGGWVAGQHVRLRVFFSGRVFESHPLSILNAPQGVSCLSSTGTSNELILGARVAGDWTKALNLYAQAEKDASAVFGQEKQDSIPLDEVASKESAPVRESEDFSGSLPRYLAMENGAQVQVMLDGPYGGSSLDLGSYESVLLVAGGSGATFTLGMLDDIVGRCVTGGRKAGEKTRQIEFAWCIRSFASIEWFAPMLMDIATVAASPQSTIALHISVFVTCLCNPEAIPPIPNSNVTIERPDVANLLNQLIATTETDSPAVSRFRDEEKGGETFVVSTLPGSPRKGGGIAVCASGPESLTRETANVVAHMSLRRGIELGGIALHAEVFAV